MSPSTTQSYEAQVLVLSELVADVSRGVLMIAVYISKSHYAIPALTSGRVIVWCLCVYVSDHQCDVMILFQL